MNRKRILTAILALILLLSLTAGCGTTPAGSSDSPKASESVKPAESEKPAESSAEVESPAATEASPESNAFADKITISMSVLDAEKSGLAEKNKWFNAKFNVEWKYIPVTWGDWMEKTRAWVAADDTPDILWWDMKLSHTAEFRAWANQGAFREFPADLSPWPELGKRRDELTSDDKVLSIDGKLYGWPAFRNNPEWLKNAYYPLFAYRRDWAKELGLYKEGDVYTWDEVLNMIKVVKEKDPGKNGVGNTFGITSEAWAFPGVFQEILGMAEDRNGYVKKDGKYVPYASTPEFLEELKFVTKLYRDGVIWKDQMVVGGNEGADNFYAGRSFMFLGNNSPDWFNTVFPKMMDSKIIAAGDQIGPMIVLSPKDNKTFWLTQTEDYWTVSNMSHKVDDAKQKRILDMWNWLLTEDGRRFTLAGVPEKDYKDNGDGTMSILWEKNADGSFKSPYKDNAFSEFTPPGLLKSPNEGTDKKGYDAFVKIFDFIQNSPDYHVHPLSWEQATFGGEQFAAVGYFWSDVNTKVKEVMAAKDDPTVMWEAFMKEMMPKYAPVMAELDAQLK